MTVNDVIKGLTEKYPGKTINIYYYADLNDGRFDTDDFHDEFVGVASYHDGELDTSEDPDGWSLEDEVDHWSEYVPNEEEARLHIIPVKIHLGKWY